MVWSSGAITWILSEYATGACDCTGRLLRSISKFGRGKVLLSSALRKKAACGEFDGVEASKVGRVDRCCCSGMMWRPRASWAMPAVDYGRKTCACAGKSRIVATCTERHRSCLFFCNDTQHSERKAMPPTAAVTSCWFFCSALRQHTWYTQARICTRRGDPPPKGHGCALNYSIITPLHLTC